MSASKKIRRPRAADPISTEGKTRNAIGRRMAAVRQRHTAPEVALRTALRKLGIRIRLHDRGLPGTPDIVIPLSRIVCVANGCFWHRHEGCSRTTMPRTNVAFWTKKFEENVARDLRNLEMLRGAGWLVYVAWECEIKRDVARIAGDIAAIHGAALSAEKEPAGKRDALPNRMRGTRHLKVRSIETRSHNQVVENARKRNGSRAVVP